MVDNKEEKEIDLLELACKLWDNKKFIIKVTLIGAVVGLVVAFSMPKEYTSAVIFTVDSNTSSAGNMGALASLAGINLNNQSSEILSPELYPNIMNSTAFVKGLLNIKVRGESQGIDTTLYTYLKDEQKEPWWNYIVKAPGAFIGLFRSNVVLVESSENRYFISSEESNVIDEVKKMYSINTDKKIGTTILEVTTQDPFISAFLADTITSYLQSYIIGERTKKAKTDLENTEKLFSQAKVSYYKKQQELASFLDANMNVISAKYRINQERLQNEVGTAYSLYNQMAQQLQMAKVKVQDDTPVFTIIQPSVEPIKASAPSKKLILGSFLFLSFLLSSLWIIKRDLWNFIRF